MRTMLYAIVYAIPAIPICWTACTIMERFEVVARTYEFKNLPTEDEN